MAHPNGTPQWHPNGTPIAHPIAQKNNTQKQYTKTAKKQTKKRQKWYKFFRKKQQKNVEKC